MYWVCQLCTKQDCWCFSAAVDRLDRAGDRDRDLQEGHVVRLGRGTGTEHGQIQVMMKQRSVFTLPNMPYYVLFETFSRHGLRVDTDRGDIP